MFERAYEWRASARRALQNRWWQAVLVCLVAALLGDGTDVFGELTYRAQEYADYNVIPGVEVGFSGIYGFVMQRLDKFIVLSWIYFAFTLILGGVMSVGSASYFMKLQRGEACDAFGTLFHPFKFWGKALGMHLLVLVRTFLWTLLFIIPGIIAGYSYAMAPYILAENPELTPSQAVNRSAAMMSGHRMELFVLSFTFIGWHLLAAFSLGLGYIFFTPYINSAGAAFYMDLKQNAVFPNDEQGPYI